MESNLSTFRRKSAIARDQLDLMLSEASEFTEEEFTPADNDIAQQTNGNKTFEQLNSEQRRKSSLKDSSPAAAALSRFRDKKRSLRINIEQPNSAYQAGTTLHRIVTIKEEDDTPNSQSKLPFLGNFKKDKSSSSVSPYPLVSEKTQTSAISQVVGDSQSVPIL